jgi:glycosyltransferase involved in cell wall biosynthesis
MGSGEPKIAVSVVIVTFNAERHIARCLEALAAGHTDQPHEIIVVDSGPDRTAQIVAGRFAHVKLIRFDHRKYPGDARNHGIAAAQGRLIACVDADCVAAGDWIDRIVAAHEQSDALAIGGAIGNGEPANLVAWAAYFCEFTHWMPGQPARVLADVPAANVSYKRQAFERYGMLIEGTYCSDTEFHWRFAPGRIAFDPTIHVDHHSRERTFGYFAHEFGHGRAFGRVRCTRDDFGRGKCLVYVLLGWLVPAVVLGRIVRNECRARYRVGRFIRCLPWLIGGVVCWVSGEWVSYLRGALGRGRRAGRR